MEDVTGKNEGECDNGFKRASFVSKKDKRESEDFSFMKKRVRVNVVDKSVQEYCLEQDEINAKKKGKRYW
jgi:hypothetical protein